MSRNRCSTRCCCGYELSLSDCVTRPLSFDEYIKAIGWKECPYESEYSDLIVAKAICPECGRQYAYWLHHESVFQHGGRICRAHDTSYWHSFNDEPCELCRNQFE